MEEYNRFQGSGRSKVALVLAASAALVGAVSQALAAGRVFGLIAAAVIVVTLVTCLILVFLDGRSPGTRP